MARDAVLAECVQHLRASAFEYEQLLGASVERAWFALAAHVEQQLRARRGVNVALLGKFAFVRDVQPSTPVFLLADRFASMYGVAWKRPPPALVAPAADVSMALLGSEIGLPKEQTQRTLEALMAFIGGKLQRGAATGRLRVGNVGALCLDGKALSFAFSPAFVRAVGQTSKRTTASDAIEHAVQRQRSSKSTMHRSASTKSVIPVVRTNKNSADQSALSVAPTAAAAVPVAAASRESSLPLPTTIDSDDRDRNRHHHHHRHHEKRHTRSTSHLPERAATAAVADNNAHPRQLLPRFLLASRRVPDGARVHCETPGSPYKLTLDAAFARERDLRAHAAAAVAMEDAALADRSRAVQLRKLTESAAVALKRRELDAFLHHQMADKQIAMRHEQLRSATCDSDDVTILPREPLVPAAALRAAKQQLCAKLSEQVTAKRTFAADRKALEQAESAYFLAQLAAQSAVDKRDETAKRRTDQLALLSGWQQQQALHADAPKCIR